MAVMDLRTVELLAVLSLFAGMLAGNLEGKEAETVAGKVQAHVDWMLSAAAWLGSRRPVAVATQLL
jgi:hypothetical protein